MKSRHAPGTSVTASAPEAPGADAGETLDVAIDNHRIDAGRRGEALGANADHNFRARDGQRKVKSTSARAYPGERQKFAARERPRQDLIVGSRVVIEGVEVLGKERQALLHPAGVVGAGVTRARAPGRRDGAERPGRGTIRWGTDG